MVSGAAPLPQGQHPAAGHLVVTGDNFRALQIPVLRGRAFHSTDNKKSPFVIMINDAFARRFFSGRDPIGQQIRIDGEGKGTPLVREVIGVVGNSRHASLAAEPRPEFYVPLAQESVRSDVMSLVLRTSASNLAGLHGAVKRAVQEVDKDLFVPKLEPMGTLISIQLAQPRFNMMLLGVFAAVALTLAAIGIYGVIAYSVAQRTREIGIRMALGAQRTDMFSMILLQSLSLVAIGLTIGLVASFAGTRMLTSLLYGVGAADPGIYAAVVLVLAGAALLASYIPARRAMKVDPMVALRYE
jgi:putative ABC transport system permease protein